MVQERPDGAWDLRVEDVLPVSELGLASLDLIDRAGDEGGLVGEQEAHDFGDLVDVVDGAPGGLGGDGGADLGWERAC